MSGDGSQTAYNFHLANCWKAHQTKNMFNMPWDLTMTAPHEVHQKSLQLFTWDKHLTPMPVINPLEPSQDLAGCLEDAFKRVGLKAAKSSDTRLWEERLSWERKCACKKWCTLILQNIRAWDIGVKSFESGPLQYAKGGLMESVIDALSGKASSTLHNRANHLIKYAKFWNDQGIDAFPIHEHMVYSYLKSRDDFAPSAPRSLLVSLSFGYHVLGLVGGDLAVKSSRVRGISTKFYCDRKKLVQKPPLTVAQIIELEKIVHSTSKTDKDRIAAGFFLMLVFGRLRFSDGMQINAMTLDCVFGGTRPLGYLECTASKTKTSITLERKVRHLPIAIPLVSFADPCWVFTWLELRAKANLEAKENVPLLPAPHVDGRWSGLPLQVGSGGDWLRSLLNLSQHDANRPATHSCKASLLSMAAKWGMNHGHRRFLGYHSKGSDQSMLVYSRDAMAAPLRSLDDMIAQIRESKFKPDETRSGFFPERSQSSEASPPEATVSDSSDSGSSGGEEETEDEFEEKVIAEVVGDWRPKLVEGQTFARHSRSRCIHALIGEGGTHFKCGRPVTTNYEHLTSPPKFMHPACNGCFKL